MTGRNQHHSSAAWCAPYKTRHTHAKIRNWPALQESHRYISSSNDRWARSHRVWAEYGESRREGEVEMRWQTGSKGKPEHAMQPVCEEEIRQMLESSRPKNDVQDESNFSPGEINQLEGKRFKEKRSIIPSMWCHPHPKFLGQLQ